MTWQSGTPVRPGSRRWRWTVPLVGLAVLLHLAILDRETGRGNDAAGLGAIRFSDEQAYYVRGAGDFAERGWAFLRHEDVLRSPPLPWMWLLVWGRSIVVTRLANIGLVILGSLFVTRIARDRFGNRFGVMAFVLCAGGYQVVLYSGTVLTEPLGFFFVCLSLWAVHRAGAGCRLRYVVLAGIACGLGALSRPSLQLFPVVLAAVWWLAGRPTRRSGEEPGASMFGGKRTAALVGSYLVIVGPWIVKNYVTCGVARISNGFGAVMYLGSDLRADGDEPGFWAMDWQTGVIPRPHGHMEIEGDRRLMAAAVENIRRHPAAWARLCVRKAGRILIGGPKWHFFPADHYQGKAFMEGAGTTALVFAWWTVAGTAVTLFGLWGLVVMLREHRALAAAGLALVAYLVGLHAISYALPRFAVPFYPALVLGCCGYMSRKRGRVPTILLALACVVVPAHLAVRHQFRPRCEVPAGKLDYFTIDRTWTVPSTESGPVVLDVGGVAPPFNPCLFIRATVKGGRDGGVSFGILHLRAADTDGFDEQSEIQFPLICDGRPHMYQLCFELQARWRARRWDALRFATVPPGGATGRKLEFTLAH